MTPSHEIEYTVHVHPEEGAFWAEVLELPGCFAAADTEPELWEALREAISMCLSTETAPVTVAISPGEKFTEQKILVSS